MTKLLRRKSASDSEQLLSPRKSGLFGKRNNGVRSEDIHPEQPNKALKSRRSMTMTSLLKNSLNHIGTSRNNDYKKEKGSPATIRLEPFGDHQPHYTSGVKDLKNVTQKTAPPSPDLVVLTSSRDQQRHTSTHRSVVAKNNKIKEGTTDVVDGDETVMSDLTGTIAPTPPQLPPASAAHVQVQAEYLNDATASHSNPHDAAAAISATTAATAHSVTFSHRQESFYSAYSPAMGVFRSEDASQPRTTAPADGTGSLVQSSNVEDNSTASLGGGGGKGSAPARHRDPLRGYCKSAILDQVLGVVDGACHRTMDLTLGGMPGPGSTAGTASADYRSRNTLLGGTAKSKSNSPQWGVAPSDDEDDDNEDDDESTCLDTNTMGDTMGGTTTQYTGTGTNTTTTDYISTAHTSTVSRCSAQGAPTGTATATTTYGSVVGRIETVPEESHDTDITITGRAKKGDTEGAGILDQKVNSQSLPIASVSSPEGAQLEGELSELHENFELVLGQNALTGKYNDDFYDNPDEHAKKRGWGSRLPFGHGNAGVDNRGLENTSLRAANSTNIAATKTLSAVTTSSGGGNKEEEKKDDDGALVEKQAAGAKSELLSVKGRQPSNSSEIDGISSPTSSSGPTSVKASTTPESATDERREDLYKSVFGEDFAESPSRDVGIEIQSRRVLKKDLEEKKQLAAAAVIAEASELNSNKKSKTLSGLVKRLKFGKGKMRRTKSSSSVLKKAHTSAFLKTPTSTSRDLTNIGFGSTTLTNPVLNEQEHKEAISAALDVKDHTFTGEEKKEVEPRDTPDVEDVAAAYGATAMMLEDNMAPRMTIMATRCHTEMTGLSSQPIMLKDRSSSMKVPSSSRSKATDMPESVAADSLELNETIPLNRLQSAPVNLTSSEGLQQQKKAEEDGVYLSTARKEAGRQREMPARQKAPKLTWKAVLDEKGRTYYYHRLTRKTTWAKPAEFDAEVASVKKYKADVEAAKIEASETQQVIDGCKNVEAIQASLRKKTQRDFDPNVWETKQEILDIVKTMPLPSGTNIEKLLVQYDGKEDQLLNNLRDLVESKPFDEPFQTPNKSRSRGEPCSDSRFNLSHSSSSVSSSANFQTIDVQHRVRTAVSASTRISEKTYVTEKTEKIRNTSNGLGIDTIRENGAMSTGSISSASDGLQPRSGYVPFDVHERVPSKIPVLTCSCDLEKREANGDGENLRSIGAESGHVKAVAEQIVAVSSLDDDYNSYNADYDEAVDDIATDTASEKMLDSISALSEADADYQLQKINFERARRRALDAALEREDWDLAAALSEGMKQVKDSLHGQYEHREWTQTELDRFISENDWDAVSKYIAHMRDHPTSSASASSLSISTSRQQPDPCTGRDPDGFAPSSVPPLSGAPSDKALPRYVTEATKRASSHTQLGRRKEENVSSKNVGLSQGDCKLAQTRFGARSQLQHSDLNSISSWDNSSSSYDSEFTDNSYESEDDQGYISLRVRRNEFEC